MVIGLWAQCFGCDCTLGPWEALRSWLPGICTCRPSACCGPGHWGRQSAANAVVARFLGLTSACLSQTGNNFAEVGHKSQLSEQASAHGTDLFKGITVPHCSSCMHHLPHPIFHVPAQLLKPAPKPPAHKPVCQVGNASKFEHKLLRTCMQHLDADDTCGPPHRPKPLDQRNPLAHQNLTTLRLGGPVGLAESDVGNGAVGRLRLPPSLFSRKSGQQHWAALRPAEMPGGASANQIRWLKSRAALWQAKSAGRTAS